MFDHKIVSEVLEELDKKYGKVAVKDIVT